MREVAADRRKELLFQKAKEFLNHRHIFFRYGKLPIPASMPWSEAFESMENIQRSLPPSTTLEMQTSPSQTSTLEMRPLPSQTPTLEMRPPPTLRRFDNFQLWPPHLNSSSSQPHFKEPEHQPQPQHSASFIRPWLNAQEEHFKEPEHQPQPQHSASFIRPWLNAQEEHFKIGQTATIRPLPPLKFYRKKHPSPPPDMNNFGETEISTNHPSEGQTFVIDFENATFQVEGERQTETFEGEGERERQTEEEGERERQTEEVGERERQAFERTREEEERERQAEEGERERQEFERIREEGERERQEFERIREEGERERQAFDRKREEKRERQKETETSRERIGAQKRKASHYTECKCYQCKFEKKF